MKKSFIIFILFLTSRVFSQSHELNVGVGMANYFGDLNSVNTKKGPLDAFLETVRGSIPKMSYSVGYRYNFNQRFSFGLNVFHMYLAGYDQDNKSTELYDDPYYRLVRNLSFHTVVNQGFVDFRYEPFRTDRRWNNGKWFFSPYVSLGIGMFQFNPKTIYNGQEYELQPLGTEGQGIGGKPKYSLTEIAVPVGIGFKLNSPKRKFALGVDFSYSYATTDYIDDVSGVYVSNSVFQGAYSAAQAELVQNLANRNLYGQNGKEATVTKPGEVRGFAKSDDNFMTSQVKFIYYFLRTSGDAYYKCCGF